MLNSEPETSANRKIVKFAAALTAGAMLASCAIAIPLPPLATTFRGSHSDNIACKAGSNCPMGTTSPHRVDPRSQPVSRGKMAEDTPDFIRNAVVQDSTPQPQIQMEE
jgi:hypothetical protein